MNDKNIIAGVVVLLLAVGGVLFVMSGGSKGGSATLATAPSGALELAQCLKDRGVVFYGAFWCPHCKKQKDDFGSAAKSLPYVECSTADGKNQVAACTEKGVQSYPTWDFPDGTRLTGEQSFETLAQKSGCPFPGIAAVDITTTDASGTPPVEIEVVQ